MIETRRWQSLVIWLFHALVLVVPFIFTWVNEELFEFNKMLIVYGFAIVIGLAWLFRIIAEKSVSFKFSWFDIVVLTFLGSQVLSTIFSIHPATSVFGYYTRFHGGLLSTLSYTLLYFAFVNNVTPAHLRAFFKTMLLAAVGVTLYAIPEHFGFSPSCALITGNIASGVDCWVQDVQTRVFATFGQPNWLAAYLITVLPLAWYLLSNALIKKQRSATEVVLFGAAPILIGAAILFTKSRSGVLGLVAGFVIWAAGVLSYTLTTKKNHLPSPAWLPKALALLPILLMLVPAVYWGTPFTPSVSSFFSSFSTPSAAEPAATPESAVPVLTNRLEEGGTDSGEIRKIVWEGAVNVWKRYPILGSGVETFAYSYYLDRPLAHNMVSEWDFLYNKAHNEFLNFLATTGIVGLLTYLAFLGGIVVLAFQTWRYFTPDNPYLSIAVVSSLVALSASNFFGFSTVMVGVLLYLLPAFLIVTQDQTSTVYKPSFLAELGGYAIGTVGSIVALWLLLSVTAIWQGDKLFTLGKTHISQGDLPNGLEYLRQATEAQPDQALFHDELASVYSVVARQLALENQATPAAQLAEAAILSSNKALQLNPAHLNFYKTRAKVLINLGTLNPEFLVYAEETLKTASELAPTDPKIIYNMGLVAEALNKPDVAEQYLSQAVALKPNYLNALAELALVYQVTGQLERSRATYQTLLEYNPNDLVIKTKLENVSASISAQKK